MVSIDEAIKPKTMLMRVFFHHQLLAVVLLTRVYISQRIDEEEWLVDSVTISHTSKPWQVALMELYLPRKGQIVNWLGRADGNLAEARLIESWQNMIQRHKGDISLADSEHSWSVSLEPIGLCLRHVTYAAGAYYENGTVQGFNNPSSEE